MPNLSFCAGRVDDTSGLGWTGLEPRIRGNTTNLHRIEDWWKIMGLDRKEMVALSQVSPTRVADLSKISVEYYGRLLTTGWHEAEQSVNSHFVKTVYKNDMHQNDTMVPTDMALSWSPESTHLMYKFIENEALFERSLVSGFLKMVNA